MTTLAQGSQEVSAKKRFSPRGGNLAFAALILLALFMAQTVYLAKNTGQTVDEAFYNGIGYPIVRYNNYDFLGEHPPLMMQLGALPLLFIRPEFPIDEPVFLEGTERMDISGTGLKFLYRMGNDPYKILFLERITIILVACFLGWILICWAQELGGAGAALAALTLYTFSPDILAHSSLYTTDLGSASFFFFAVFRIKKLLESVSLSNAVWAGVACGLALLTKVSTILLIPVCFCLMALHLFVKRDGVLRDFEPLLGRISFPLKIAGLVFFILVAGQKLITVFLGPLALLAIGYAWPSWRSIRQDRKFMISPIVYTAAWMMCFISGLLLFRKSVLLGGAGLFWVLLIMGLQASIRDRQGPTSVQVSLRMFSLIWLIAAFVLMIAYTDFLPNLLRLNPFRHYLHNFMWVFSHTQTVHQSCPEGSFITCDWRYFLGVLSIKTPLVTMVLFCAGLATLFMTRTSLMDRAFLIFPPALFLAIASTMNDIYIGIRHVLILYPFIFLIAAYSVRAIRGMASVRMRRTTIAALAGALLFHVYDVTRSFPDYLSYFNSLVRSVEQGARLVGDSNLNWGQDNKRLAEYVLENEIPSVKINSSASSAGEYNHFKISWEYMKDGDTINPEPGYYALDLSTYLGEQRRNESWFRNREPIAKIGRTYYVFKTDGVAV